MTTLSIQPPFPLITDIDGQPLEDGYIWIGTANLPPIGNPIAVYWDAALTIPAALPIRTRGGYPVNAGTPARLYVGSDYSILVQNKNGSMVYSAPNGATDRLSAAQITYFPAGTNAVPTTVQAKLRETVSVFDFMTPAQIADVQAGTSTDDTAAINAAIQFGLSNKRNVYFPTGTYMYVATGTNIDLVANSTSLQLYGDGIGASVIRVNENGRIFNIKSGTATRFRCSAMSYVLLNPSTNSNATCFYISNGTSWGASFYFDECRIVQFTNCAVHAIRAFNSGAKNSTFSGNSAYSSSSGLLTTYDDAGVRLWGADGTSTSQDHSFSNVCRFENCYFERVRYGVDGWNITQSSFSNCTFEFVWIGLLNRPNPSSSGGISTSTEKGGYGIARANIDNCWFEQYAKYAFTPYDIDPSTGADVNTSWFCRYQSLGGALSGNYYNPNTPGIGVRDNTLEGISNYKSGTFTPEVFFGTTAQTLSIKEGAYTRIGNRVIFEVILFASSWTEAGTGNVTITGLPFPAVNPGLGFDYAVNITYFANYSASSEFCFGAINEGNDFITLFKGGANQRVNVTDADVAGGAFLLRASGTYRI